tara:strand:+ start:515 stop:1033 length:519 start_codon:yes stop_codon:yes gene_type:complete
MNKQKPSFEQAMNAASLWCNAWEEGSLSEEVLADRITELVATKEGARGFFAISLSSDSPLMDRLPEPVVVQLRKAGKIIVDLTTKNLAMSSAMAIHHERNQDRASFSGSERITRRCTELLRLLDPNLVKIHLESLLAAINGEGDDVNFVERWQYDKEQKIAIEESINAVAES